MGEAPPLSIKILPPPQVMKNKFSDAAAGYGFINFANDQMALTVMHKLNGKMMPNTNPPVRWKLNHSSNRLLPGEKNHSVWVGDLTPEVDDLQLYQFFSKRFQSLVSAKVVLDESGFSKGFGFIRFNNEVEQQTAMTSMNGMSGLGGKPIKVSVAVNKIKDGQNGGGQYGGGGHVPDHVYKQVANNVVGGGYGNKSSGPNSWGSPGNGQPAYGSAEYWQQYQQYQQQYQQWQQWQQHHQQHPPPNAAPQGAGGWNQNSSDASQEDTNAAWNSKQEVLVVKKGGLLEGRLDEEVDHKKQVQVDLENERTLDRSNDLWSSLEESGWIGIEAAS